ncbi:MAG: GTP 3',8-cyclase MoaA [Actinomycetota bacterium]
MRKSPIVDRFGRVATDLRVSVTDRCNFRCTYCMPAEGLQWLPRAEILTYEEIARLAGVFHALGVRTVRLTGGEPTVRRDLPELVRKLRNVAQDLDLSMTTNGLLLDVLAAPLKEAGLDRVNVSVDSLLRHRFAEMTRRDALEGVMRGLRAAEAAGLSPIKLNCVVLNGTNDDEVADFAAFARDTGYDVRFIEYMPLDADHGWERAKVLPSRKVLARIAERFPLIPVEHEGDPSPATTCRFADGAPGTVGVIASVTEPFCDSCDRMRLTADGQFRSCLFALNETNLRDPLRAGASAEELEALIRAAMWEKWSGHRINHPDFVQPQRTMSSIGG